MYILSCAINSFNRIAGHKNQRHGRSEKKRVSIQILQVFSGCAVYVFISSVLFLRRAVCSAVERIA
ncbi:hypothetical protein [Bathymodiolus japonicus methanotrophic gill symbiont]|uniref:hypothetical protein n=1 Tax=Bathymodiolus japonicus methanotrophic gill symbiont TaxID=113269 RepID=UPI001C8D8735|nr:hypothetical protein [Bathymodiolus japonicus methanotrophic gill symbiont]